MVNSFKLVAICFLLCCCTLSDTITNLERDCEMPYEIEAYLNENSHKWSKLGLSDFNEELLNFLSDAPKKVNKQNCPYFLYGDFDNDGKEDFAIILKNKTYKVDEYGNYKFPFLVVFNDFEESLEPHVIYKTGLYKNETVKTVVHSDAKQGIMSYLSNGVVGGNNVINVTYFEKSEFFVYWDRLSNSYEYLNYLDENLHEKVKGEKYDTSVLTGTWSNQCEYEQAEFTINDGIKVFLSLQSDNEIYINCLLELDPKKNDTYNLFFNSVASQQRHYEDQENIIERDISKEESIARVKFIDHQTFELDWKGLYNLKTKEIDFATNFMFLVENNNISPIIMRKCIN